MPFIRLSEIRDMDLGERDSKLRELRAELLKLRATVEAGGGLENPSRIKELRKAIARIMTVQREGEWRERGLT